ncbi:MAG: ATPase domain-containing protein, partial [Asticcacaulis sp.]
MAKPSSIFACQACGAVQPKWAGQCPACGAWNTLVEEAVSAHPGALAPAKVSARQRGLVFETLESASAEPVRLKTSISEFDRVCGGGIVPGSALLLAGDPGVGKSTLLLQVTAQAALQGAKVAYISGEEAVDQVRGRAARMGVSLAPVQLAAETSLRYILEALKKTPFDLV